MRSTATVLTLALGFVASADCVFGNPTGGVIANGSASITTVPGTVTINQSSNTAIINWQTFSIGTGELTKFIQPSAASATLNRVLGGGTSVIDGALESNGQVLLINGNGILVSSTGMVNTAGFIASTRDIADSDFLAGNDHFVGSGSGSVVNKGTINGTNGAVLIGKTVDNEGSLNAVDGTAALAAGDDVLLNLSGTQHVFVNPTTSATAAPGLTAVKNGGSVAAAQAELAAANGNLYALAINNAGTVRATAVSNVGGRVFLTTDGGSMINNGSISSKNGVNGGLVKASGGSIWNRGSIDASGANGGGRIEFDVDNVQIDGSLSVRGDDSYGGSVYIAYTGNALGSVTGLVDASGYYGGGSVDFIGTGQVSETYLSLNIKANSDTGKAGRIVVDSNSVYLAGANLNASSPAGDGHIYLGVADPLYATPPVEAQTLYIGLGSKVTADATGLGNGGVIVAQSTGQSTSFGSVTASGHGPGGTSGTVVVPPTPVAPPVVASTSGASTGSTGTAGSTAPSFQFTDPDPGSNNSFGRPTTGIFNLADNTTLITSPGDSFYAAGAGAAYLFSDTTGALLGTIRGTTAGDAVGTHVQILTGSTFAVSTSNWDGGIGAVTFGNGRTGFAHGGGAISSLNSLIGSAAGDAVGSGGLEMLRNGNYLVLSPDWNAGSGAVTWVNPAFGLAGVVSAGNSLVGATAGDHVGSGGVQELSNGANYLVFSPDWSGGKGAITNGSDATGIVGAVSAQNSLVGANVGDEVGAAGSLVDTSYGYYLIQTPGFDGGAGAVTWNRSGLGTTGVLSAANSLVGSNAGDAVGNGGITILSGNRNYVVDSPDWNGGEGAVTLGVASVGVSGPVSSLNSLVGSAAGDHVGSGGIYEDAGVGKYVVLSPDWNGNSGAVSLVSSAFGLDAVLGADNSLTGAANDRIGSGGLTFLDNGNLVVNSPDFNGGMGAVTWVNAESTLAGTVSAGNSLVGTGAGASIFQLSDGSDFLVLSPNWNGGVGAVTHGSTTTGVSGQINFTTSLVGSGAGDHLGSAGSVLDSFDDYYLITDANYRGGAGAVTWGSDATPVTGFVSSVNSLVGGSSTDHVGSGGITFLPDGNYIVKSPDWNGGAGAATWGSAAAGVHALLSPVNSLTGAQAGDHVSSGGVIALDGSDYLVLSPDFGGTAGAITPGSAGGLSGMVGAANSLLGSSAGDDVGAAGSVINLYNGSYLVATPNWSEGKGAVTFSSIANPTLGVISAANSFVGSNAGDEIGSGGITVLGNDNYLIDSPNWANGTGAVTLGLGTGGLVGTVNPGEAPANSLTGANPGDAIGSGGIDLLAGGNYLVLSPNFDNGAGAVTHGTQATLATGVVSADNSFVGANAGDGVGTPGSVLQESGYYLLETPDYKGNEGAVTWSLDGTDLKGTLSASNSLVGSNNADVIGSDGIVFTPTGYFVVSEDWNDEMGAITYGSATAGVSGVVSAANSFVGGAIGDHVGSGGLLALNNGNYLAFSPGYADNAGAVTFLGATGLHGVIGAGNSLIGSHAGDGIGSSGIAQLNNGNYLVLSPEWNGGTGAVTFGNGNTGVSGVVGADNSLVGVAGGDHIGGGGIIFLNNGNYLVQSPDFAGNAGAVTWGSATAGVSGVVNAANSILGGMADAGEEYAGQSADGSVYLIAFTTDTSAGGDGRVVVGSTSGPNGRLAAAEDFLLAPAVLTVEASNFNFTVGDLAFYIADPNAAPHGSSGVDSPSGSAVNSGSGHNLASGSSTSGLSGPQRLVTPGNGIWNIFDGFVHSSPPPQFVLQQLQLSLSPQVYQHLNDLIFGNP